MENNRHSKHWFHEGQGIFIFKDGTAIEADKEIITYENYALDTVGRMPMSAWNHPQKVGRVTVCRPAFESISGKAVLVDGTKEMPISEDTFLINTPIKCAFTLESRYYIPEHAGKILWGMNDIPLLCFTDDEKIVWLKTGETICGYSLGALHTVRVFVSISERTADFYLDGRLIKKSLPFDLDIPQIVKISVTADGGKIYIDEMICFAGIDKPKHLPPDGSFVRFHNARVKDEEIFAKLGVSDSEPDEQTKYALYRQRTFERPDENEIISDIKKNFPGNAHHRLYMTDKRRDRILKRIAQGDAETLSWLNESIKSAEEFLNDEVPEYFIEDGIRLLSVARLIKRRCLLLSSVYRLTGDERFAEKCWDYLCKAAQYPDWNETHFLDTAELCCGFAITYDAIYDWLNDNQKKICIAAIKEKALIPALLEYRYGNCGTRNCWSDGQGNWNPVCNAGMIIGAIAIADTDEALAAEIISSSLYGIEYTMTEFAPDGAWREGVGYWHYTIEFICYYFDALFTSCGKIYNYLNVEGVRQTVNYYLAMLGPGGTFNYGDMSPQYVETPEFYWYAEVLGDANLMQIYKRISEQYGFKPTIRTMLHYDGDMCNEGEGEMPLDMVFGKWWVGSIRSSWDKENSVYVAFQGGRPNVGHSQMSIGNFVLDAMNERWALDLGYDDYNLNYLDCSENADAWWIYRKSAEGHNCLIINPDDKHFQVYDSDSPICDFHTEEAFGSAMIDLTRAYSRNAVAVFRSFMLDRRTNAVTITDDFELLKENSECYWFMHTAADIEILKGGKTARLSQNGKVLFARVESPSNGVFSIMEPVPLPTTPKIEVRNREAKNEGIKKLTVHLTGLAGKNTISISFS